MKRDNVFVGVSERKGKSVPAAVRSLRETCEECTRSLDHSSTLKVGLGIKSCSFGFSFMTKPRSIENLDRIAKV